VSLPTQRALDIDLDVPADFGNWLAGLTDGEGSFYVSVDLGRRSVMCRFSIGLRADDGGLLEEIRERLGDIGSISGFKTGNVAPMVAFYVSAQADVLKVLIPFFDRYPLRSKKKLDYALWKEAALLIGSKQHLTPDGLAQVLRLKAEMEAGRKYNGANGANGATA